MNPIQVVEREMTASEFAWLNTRYEQHHIEHGSPVQTSEKYGVVALAGETFVGCVAGSAERDGLTYNPWFYLSDLFVKKAFRKQGLGATLLRKLEERVAQLGVQNMWTWTAGYEAPGFYKKQGYHVFCEQENRYASGHSQVGLRKALRQPALQLQRDARPLDVYGSDENPLHFVERDMTEAEFAQMNAGFDEHTLEHGNPIETSERCGFVAVDGECFIGCMSGLASRNWFTITDLFVDKPYREQGLGGILLRNMEDRVTALGIRNISVYCASFEAPEFYKKRGYKVVYELGNWDANGHSRLCLQKGLNENNP